MQVEYIYKYIISMSQLCFMGMFVSNLPKKVNNFCMKSSNYTEVALEDIMFFLGIMCDCIWIPVYNETSGRCSHACHLEAKGIRQKEDN